MGADVQVAAQQLEAAQAETSILTAKISYLETTVEDDKQKLAVSFYVLNVGNSRLLSWCS